MKSSPTISVIIPNYNHASYLDERIQSVLNQTYQNFEVIILDDKSTDNSLEVINKYKDNPHVAKIIVNEQNSGSPFKQWEKGFKLAKGELIWIAESDDSCEKTFLEKLVKEHIEKNNVVTFCRSQKMDENGLKYDTFQNGLKKGNWNGRDFIQRFLGKGNIITNASSVVFNKKDALSVDTQYKSYKGSGDWLFWIELVQNGYISFIDETLNFFRKHGTNTTEKLYSNGLDFLEDKKIFDYLVKKQLINSHSIKSIKRRNLVRFTSYPFDNEEIRKKVLKTWKFSFYERFRLYVSFLFDKIWK